MLEKKGCNKEYAYWRSTHSEVRKKNAVDSSLRLEGKSGMGLSKVQNWKKGIFYIFIKIINKNSML